jgi:hypothetical protein
VRFAVGLITLLSWPLTTASAQTIESFTSSRPRSGHLLGAAVCAARIVPPVNWIVVGSPWASAGLSQPQAGWIEFFAAQTSTIPIFS